MKRKRKPAGTNAPPPAIIIDQSDTGRSTKGQEEKPATAGPLPQQQGNEKEYQPKGATVSLEPILENKTLRIPRQKKKRGSGSDKTGYDPNDPLLRWYFPRRSPDYWEMLDDISKMFSDLHMQEVTLKHFQRPIDYVTVLLCLSNVVFAEMFSTLREKVSESQYRIEFVVTGRTGVNLYLSAYSREHIYIAKSFLHKVNMQLDLAKKHSPRSTIQYIQLIECVERYLVHDRRRSWGRISDGHFTTWTDTDSPTVVHEIGIAESRPELYRRCKRYIQDVPCINLVVAIKIDSSECEWAELLVLTRNPHDNKICKIFNWVRFYGEGAVNRGELRYYPSDFLEVEDRWKIPKAHMRPLDAAEGPRCSIVKISFGELARMVSLARWENQALMGYIKKPYPWPAGYGSLTHMETVSLQGEEPPPPPDMTRTMALATALNSRQWKEPFVVRNGWEAEADSELADIMDEIDEDGRGGGLGEGDNVKGKMDANGMLPVEEEEDDDV